MSSGGNVSNDNEAKLSNLRAILGNEIPKARLSQILEASNGSLEHAVDIYFNQMQQLPQCSKRNPKGKYPQKETLFENESSETTVDRRHEESNNARDLKIPSASPDINRKIAMNKQARLDSFFRVDSDGAPSFPLPIQKSKGPKRRFDLKTKGGKKPKINASMTRGIIDLSSRNAPTSKAISKPASNNLASKEVDVKNENPACENPVSFLSFQRLCETLQQMSDTTKRLVKIEALQTLIREIIDFKAIVDINIAPRENCNVSMRASTLSAALELVLGGVTSRPLNVSGSAVSKALQTSLGINRNQISKAYRKNGDIGDCAASFFQKKSHFIIASNRRRLSILQVAKGLRDISETNGRDSKQHILLSLLRDCQSKMECRFLVRLLVRNMRIGANMKTVLAALATAVVSISCKDEECKDLRKTNDENSNSLGKGSQSSKPSEIGTKDAITLVQKTYDICPRIPKLVSALLDGGLDQMRRDCTIQVMTPIAPMLAHPIHSLKEIEEKMGNCGDNATMEWKYDGMRCQAHYDGSNIKLFSRHMLDMTDQFPDVIHCVKEAVKIKNPCDSYSFVIDAEIVGVEGQGGESRLLPFQDLSTRRKKKDDGHGIRVKVFAFDIMFLNGDSLVNEQHYKRTSILHELFAETNDFSFVSSQKLEDYDESNLKTFLSEAIENGAEGLMIKLLGKTSKLDSNKKNSINEELFEGTDSFYEAGTRSHSWLKVKRDYVAGFSDTIDVVPIGAWWGSGRKAQKSFLSPILLAVYDDEEDVYRSICRCMTFTDAMYESLKAFYFNGIAYPSCEEPQYLKNIRDNSRQKDLIEDHTIIGDDKSYDDHNDNNQAYDKNHCDLKKEDDERTYETNRVNCFPERPSSAFVVTNETPPIWFKPMEVFEVAFADLSLSRQHTAAAGLVDEEGRGVALRFPRFKRRRPDKKPEQATTSIEVAQLFAKQSKIKNGSRTFQPNRSK